MVLGGSLLAVLRGPFAVLGLELEPTGHKAESYRIDYLSGHNFIFLCFGNHTQRCSEAASNSVLKEWLVVHSWGTMMECQGLNLALLQAKHALSLLPHVQA